MASSNESYVLEIKTDSERYAWSGWCLFVILTSFIGDTTILLASIKYKAFQLQEVLVTFIKHIAVTDLLVAATYVIPTFVSLIANRWIFGETMCHFQPYPVWSGTMASMLFICGMVFSKLLFLKYPLKARTWFSQYANKLCGGIWGISMYYPLCFLVLDQDDASFDRRVYFCNPNFSSKVWKFLLPINFSIFCLLPILTTIIATIMLLVEAKKIVSKGRNERGGYLRWQGIMTSIMTSSVYIMSYLPITVYFTAAPFVSHTSPGWAVFHIQFHRVAVSLTHTNIMANFFIYSLTVTSFRNFVRQRMQRFLIQIFCILSCEGNSFCTSVNVGNQKYSLVWLLKLWVDVCVKINVQ